MEDGDPVSLILFLKSRLKKAEKRSPSDDNE
jgi:hypothetical protein